MKLKIIKIKGDWADEIKHYQPNFGRSFIKKTIISRRKKDFAFVCDISN